MRVVWVTPYLPIQYGGGGAVHEYELLRMAARRHDIHVLCAALTRGEETLDLGDGVSATIEGVEWNEKARPKGRLAVVLRVLFTRPSLSLFPYRDRTRKLARALTRCAERESFDLVHITHGEIAPVVGVAQPPTALLLFDLYTKHERRGRQLDEAEGIRKSRFGIAERKMAAWERRWYGRASSVACVSNDDASELATMLGRPIPVVTNPIANEFFEPPTVPRSRATVVFVGNLGYPPNVDAVEWLTSAVWPRVLAQLPAATLEIVGTNPTAAVTAAASRAGAALHSDVGDVRPFYWRAAVAVAPIRLGSGVRNKVIHAIACGAPVVATSAAVEGLAVDARQVLVADDPRAFAASVVATIRDGEAARARTEAARTIVAPHRAETVGESLDGWWQEAARDKGQPRPDRAVDELPVDALVDEMTSATVVVCTRNRPAQLRESLPAIAVAVSCVPACELLIVEQGDRVVEDICAALDVKATVVHDDGLGAARARNTGSRFARGDVLLFTDDDCDVGPTWVLDHLRALHDQRLTASFGAVDGLTRFATPDVVDATRRRRRHRRGTPPWFVGHSANMAVTRPAFGAVGGFDERLGPGAPGGLIGEDADLIFRLLRRGAVVASGVGDPVQHIGWRSTGEETRNLVAYERGAGAWIGKALRQDRRAAVPYLCERVTLLWNRAAHHPGLLASPVPILRSIGAFAVGLVRGLGMSAWREP